MKKGYAERCYSGRTQTEFEVKLVKQFADQNNLKY